MKLGDVIRKWRKWHELDLRTAAKIIGLNSPATLMRIENGLAPSAESLATILKWLMSKAESK